MHKTYLLILGLLIQHTLFAQNTYYISSSGNDANNGTSSRTPWKTLKYYEAGNTYLFKRGEVFNISVPLTWAHPTYKTVIADYGRGDKPVFSLYTQVKGLQLVRHSDNVWKVDLSNKNNFGGYLGYNSNIGFLKIEGTIYGNKLPILDLLAKQWDFYTDENFLYIYSSTTPSSDSIIEFSSNGVGIQMSSNITIKNVKVVGSGGHGIAGWMLSDVTLEGVDVSEIGGAYLAGFGDGTVRYGNGIEFWNGTDNCVIQGCTVTQVYDVAYTMQGIGEYANFRNTVFRNNTADQNEQSFEAWAREGAPGFINCSFIENTCSNAGFGWSHEVRPSKTEAVHLLSYIWDVTNTDLVVENNTFNNAKSGLYHHNTHLDIPPYTSRNNTIFLAPSVPIRAHFQDITIENANAFVALTGKETGSTFNYVSTAALPVTLLSFSAVRSTNSVKISWQTSDKYSNDTYVIERSLSNTNLFESIGFVSPSTSESTSFEFIDMSPSDGASYYRLKQLDIDGHVIYSNIVNVPAKSTQGKTNVKGNLANSALQTSISSKDDASDLDNVTVYPNPSSGFLRISTSTKESGNRLLIIYNLTGSKLYEELTFFSPEKNSETLNISFLPSGHYILKITGYGNENKALKFVKN